MVLLVDKNKWCVAIRLPILYKLKENLDDILMVQLFTNCEFTDPASFLGQANVNWKLSINADEQWNPSCTVPLQ